MTLTEHLEELRWCLLRSVIAVLVGSTVCYFFSNAIFAFMVAPLRQTLQPGQGLIGTSVTEAFFSEIKVAIAAGVFFTCPFIFYQIWRFIAPGLSGSEKKLVLPFVSCATLFFLGGAYFCYRIVLPVAFKYFVEQYNTMGVLPAIRIGEYFTFFFRMILAFGITFELPVFTFFFGAAGILELPVDDQLVSLCADRYFRVGGDADADPGYNQPESLGAADVGAIRREYRRRLYLAQNGLR